VPGRGPVPPSRPGRERRAPGAAAAQRTGPGQAGPLPRRTPADQATALLRAVPPQVGWHDEVDQPTALLRAAPPAALSPSALPAGWGDGPDTSETITVIGAMGAAAAAGRHARRPGDPPHTGDPAYAGDPPYADDPAYAARAGYGAPEGEYGGSRDGDGRAAWLARRNRAAARLRRRW
jgi:hypothetical protein